MNYMRPNAGILIFISLLLLVGTVEALQPDSITFNSNPEWVIANGIDQSAITVTIKNQSQNVTLSSSSVTFSPDSLGTMHPTNVITNSNGEATSNFKVKTKSGNATITVFVTNGTDSNTFTIYQNIDHDSPFYDFTIGPPLFTYPAEGTVGTNVSFKVSILDKWGNPIDNRRGNHLISLHASSALSPTEPYFVGYGQDIVNQPLDANGTFSVNVQLTTKSGSNKILMDPFEGKISTQIAWITAIATGNPYSMTGTISPEHALTANNVDYFVIDYFIFDIYGNLLNDKYFWVNTTLSGDGEQVLKASNSLGQIRLKYGPKSIANNITITATSIDNQSVTNTLHAEFVPAGATDMVLIISPQVLMSRELPNSAPAQVYGMVTSSNGFPIQGEIVTFEILSITNNPSGVKTGDPSFSSTDTVLKVDATTDNNGIASVSLYPGSFNSSYNSTASGSCYVKATWNSQPTKNPNIQVEWKNYPYLSIQVDATPQTVRVNDTILFNITVTGNGYKMVSHPIAVVLDLDTSSSLHSVSAGDKDTNGLKRFENEKIVAKNFVDSLNASTQVGLVTYGFYPNNQFWQLINDVSLNHALVNASIGALIESGGLNVSIRDSVHEAVTQLTDRTRPPEEVGAIIVIGDSSYEETDFAPMVQEAWGNGIRIYTVQYVSALNNCDGHYAKDLTNLSVATHGKFYCNNTRENIMAALADIKRNLTDIAGANATMELSFENVPVNSTPMTGGQVFDYVPETKTTWPNTTVTYKNQSSEWVAPDYQLHFNIGTIKIGEVWQTEYRLKLKTNQTGLIELFASKSNITFNDGSVLNLPAVFLTAVSDQIFGSQSGTLDISNLLVTKSGKITDYVPLEWNFLYTGFSTATETMWYSKNNGTWVQYDSRPGIAPGNYTHIGQIDVREFPPGNYRIKVHGVAPDSNDDNETTAFMVSNSGTFIILR
jgi:hypothetical protein